MLTKWRRADVGRTFRIGASPEAAAGAGAGKAAGDALHLSDGSYQTDLAYLDWMKRYIFFHGKRHPKEMGAGEIEAFVSYLANERGVSASTQTQALSALLYSCVTPAPL